MVVSRRSLSRTLPTVYTLLFALVALLCVLPSVQADHEEYGTVIGQSPVSP